MGCILVDMRNFRVWDFYKGKWECGYWAIQDLENCQYDNTIEFCYSMEVLDKTGKEIYEGDIVEVEHETGVNRFLVKFGPINRIVMGHNGTGLPVEIVCFYFEGLDDHLPYFSITNNFRGEHDLAGTKVIGNIFEDPELL